MKTNDKYLILEKLDVANDRINQINAELIERINAVSTAIAACGIPVTKPMVLIALKNPTSILDARHKAFAATDAERRKVLGDEMFDKMTSDIETPMLDNLVSACNAITGNSFTFYNGMSISNPAVLDWFDINDNGDAFIPDKIVVAIQESQRKYISTAVGKELRDIQCEIADKLEKMYQLMRHIKNDDPTLTLDYDANAIFVKFFPVGLFECIEKDDYMHVIPRRINFDPVDRDEMC